MKSGAVAWCSEGELPHKMAIMRLQMLDEGFQQHNGRGKSKEQFILSGIG